MPLYVQARHDCQWATNNATAAALVLVVELEVSTGREVVISAIQLEVDDSESDIVCTIQPPSRRL